MTRAGSLRDPPPGPDGPAPGLRVPTTDVTASDPPSADVEPLTLLIVNPMGSNGWGGVERWLMDLSLGLRDRGHTMLMVGRPASQWVERSREHGFEAWEQPLRADFHLTQARDISRLIQDRGVDAVLTKLHRGIRVSGFAAKLAGSPPVIAFMGLVETRRGLRYRMTYELFLDRVVTLSQRMADQIAVRGALESDTVEVIPYGVRPDAYVAEAGARERLRRSLGLADDAPVALALGRLNMQKRFDLLLQAFAEVRERLPQARLLIAGTGKLEPNLRAKHERLGLGESVQFLGFRRDVGDLLSAADLLVLSSDDEGLPHVILEAMAAGRAVVSTRVGSVDDLVDDGRTGLLIPRRDPAALRDALVETLGDRERLRAMGRAGRERVVTEYPLQRCIERTESYLDALRRSGSTTA